jgi:hypothetical protein
MSNIRIRQSVAANHYCPDHGGIDRYLGIEIDDAIEIAEKIDV